MTRCPELLQEALQVALDLSLQNVPSLAGEVFLAVDCSVSMDSPVTGERKGATTKMTCREAAGLIAAAIWKKSQTCGVIPFANDAYKIRLNKRDSVASLAHGISHACSGGTNLSAPLEVIEHYKPGVDLFIFLSDNESWVDASGSNRYRGTGVMQIWNRLSATLGPKTPRWFALTCSPTARPRRLTETIS